MRDEAVHPIKVVSGRTGLSQHLIRAWESRYGAIEPQRTSTNRRLYTDSDIERLRMLKRATEAGRGISQVAGLSNQELATLIAGDSPAPPYGTHGPIHGSGAVGDDAGIHLDRCLREVHALNARGLEAALLQASVALSPTALTEELVLPLMMRMGELWQQGKLRPAHEHLASHVIRTFLGNMLSSYLGEPSAPLATVATPAGQVHEFGALAAAATAASEGWQVNYLGANLPAEEIAAAATQNHARLVGLSLVYPTDDIHIHKELQRLRKLIPDETQIVVGGRAAPAYGRALDAIGAVRMASMADLRSILRSLRAGPPKQTVA